MAMQGEKDEVEAFLPAPCCSTNGLVFLLVRGSMGLGVLVDTGLGVGLGVGVLVSVGAGAGVGVLVKAGFGTARRC